MNLQKILVQFLFFLLFSVLLVDWVLGSDLEKEARWAEQVEADLFDGEALYLKHDDGEFLVLSTLADLPNDTAILVLHGLGVHPDWPQVINPLRVSLVEYGWSTLSAQMPILSSDASAQAYESLLPEVPSRMIAGLRYLRNQGASNIVIVAHSMGARMVNYFLAHAQKTELAGIKAYIAVGMNRNNEQWLSAIFLPILDVYGEHDLPGVLDSASSRADAAQTNTQYQQMMIEGADHFFEGHHDQLLEPIIDWLSKKGL